MKLFGFDLETFLWVDGLAAPQLVCGSWSDGVTDHVGDHNEALRFFRETLERGDHLVGTNLAFDIVVAAAADPSLLPLVFKAGNRGQFHDIAIREALNDIAKGEMLDKGNEDENGKRYSLEILMQRHYGINISPEKKGDVWRYKYASLYGKPLSTWPLEATEYPKRDARRPFDICNKQKRDGFKNLHDEPAQMRAAIAIQLMRVWGFRTDGDYIAHLEKEVDELWENSRVEFAKAGIFEPQTDGSWKKSTKVLGELVRRAYTEQGAPVPMTKGRKNKAGVHIPAVATDRDTLEESGDPLLVKLASSGKNDKRKTTYIPALKRGIDVPLITEFDVLKITGRVSSDFQQMPQKGGIREAVVSRGFLRWLRKKFWDLEDTVMCSLDYGGLELRTMSQRAIYEVGFSKMAEFINAGKDVHCHVAAYFDGTTYEKFYALYKLGDGRAKALRGLAKIFNFGKGGGMGAGALAYNARVKEGVRFCQTLNRAPKCGVKKDEVWVQGKKKRVCSACIAVSRELGEKWLEAWPEQKALFAKAGRLTAGKKTADVTVFGSNRVRGKCTYTQWLNTPFQGAGGDGCKAAMWKIAEEAYTDRTSPLWGARVFLNVHDELLIEFPWSKRHTGPFRAAQIMREVMDAITPDAHNEVEPAIMRRLFKAASLVKDQSGQLAPWWPKGKGCTGPNTHASENCGCWKWAADQERMWADIGQWQAAA